MTDFGAFLVILSSFIIIVLILYTIKRNGERELREAEEEWTSEIGGENVSEKAQEIFEKGTAYYYGDGATKDHATAAKLYIKAAELGHPRAQCNAGHMYEYGTGVPKDYGKAKKWYLEAARQGHAIAQYNLSSLYYNGNGVSKDLVKSAEWVRKSAEQGYAAAEYRLAYAYALGEGVPEDHAKALEWCKKSAAQGHQEAIDTLRNLEDTGSSGGFRRGF